MNSTGLMENDILATQESDYKVPVAVYGFYMDVFPGGGHTYRVALPVNEVFLVGRSPNQCHLVLNDRRVSRVHLRIQRSPDQGVTITDLHTANGSQLDGRPLESGQPMTWLINQPVVIGGTHLILRYGSLDN